MAMNAIQEMVRNYKRRVDIQCTDPKLDNLALGGRRPNLKE